MELYFAGGSTQRVEDFMWNKKCSRLFSQFREKNNIKKYIERGGNNIFLDSGAFSAYNSGSIIDIDSLCDYANSITQHCKFIACLDVIGDAEKSFENFVYMRHKLIEPNKLIPAFHINEPIEYLYKYLEYEDEFGKLDKLALGGIAKQSQPNRKRFLDMCEPICERYPNVWIHLFGVTNLSLINNYQFIDSVDSTKYIMDSVYGGITIPPKFIQIYIGKRNALNNSIIRKEDSLVIQEICKKAGIEQWELSENGDARSIFDIQSMLEWLKLYNKKGRYKKIRKRRLF